jgi:hypothetical protein
MTTIGYSAATLAVDGVSRPLRGASLQQAIASMFNIDPVHAGLPIFPLVLAPVINAVFGLPAGCGCYLRSSG